MNPRTSSRVSFFEQRLQDSSRFPRRIGLQDLTIQNACPPANKSFTLQNEERFAANAAT